MGVLSGAPRWRSSSALLLVVVVTLALGAARLVLRPDLTHTVGNLTGEVGNQLYRAQALGEGRVLYADVACQYGPLPVYLHAGFCALAGVSIRSTFLFHLACSACVAALSWHVLARRIGPRLAHLAVWLWVVPATLTPGSAFGGYAEAEFPSCERLLLLLTICLWQPARQRSRERSLAAGALFSGWQLVKFGGGAAAAAAWVVLDVLVWLGARRSKDAPGRATILGWAWMLVGLALIELAIAGACLAALPRAEVGDVLWPRYMLDGYEVSAPRWPGWSSPGFFLTAQLPLLVWVAVGGVCLVRWARSSSSGSFDPGAGLALGLLYLLVGAIVHLRHEHLLLMAAWSAALTAAWSLPRLGRPALICLVVATLAPLAMGLKVTFWNQPAPGGELLTLPDGEKIVGVGAESLQLRELARLAEQTRPGSFGLVVAKGGWGGGGIHYYLDRHYPLRTYALHPALVRPRDLRHLARELPNVAWLAVLPGGRAHPAVLGLCGTVLGPPRNTAGCVVWSRPPASDPPD